MSRENVSGLTEKELSEKKPIGERIRDARKNRGLTLKGVGEKIGRTHSALSYIETGATIPDKAMLIALARTLNDDFGEDWLKEFAESSEDIESDVQRIAAMLAEGMQASGFDELDPNAKEDVLADLADIARMRIEREKQRKNQRDKNK